jgi:hypothetical protein
MIDANIVPELLRALNRIERFSPAEVRQLLHRSIVAIRDLRRHVGIPGSGTSADAVIGLANVASRVETASVEELQAALLEATEMIRTLRIVAQSGIALILHETEDVAGA